MTVEERYGQVVSEMQAVLRWDHVIAALDWDLQTQLPAEGHDDRAEQLAMLHATRHRRFVSEHLGDLLHELADDPELDEDRRRGIQNLLRDWTFAAAIPAELVERLGRLQGQGHAAWAEARAASDFSRFAPLLEQIVEVVRARAQAVDPSRPIYDVLLEEYEPGTTATDLTALFDRLTPGLVELLDAIGARPPQPTLTGTFEAGAQRRLCDDLAAVVGYDLRRGRIDLAAHPFTTRLGSRDVRITTRIDPQDLWSNVGSTMHELGHALYEQGLPQDRLGTGLDGPPSMGMHESQSRFWENTIGRSREFCRWLAPRLAERFGASVADPEHLFRTANRVAPSLIRVEADEVTYNLHIIVRFRLELALLEGRIAVRDLPEAWNQAYVETLGVRPPNDAQGVLQDVHWSAGAFAYFPTYTIGNLYAAALGSQLASEVPDLWAYVEQGRLAPILDWLRTRVHAEGRRHKSAELVARVTGGRDPVAALLDHLWGRHGALHGAKRSPTSSLS